MIHYEIVWVYRGEEYSFATYDTPHAALRDYHDGRARVHKLIHGGTLRLDEVITVEEPCCATS